MRVFVTGATGFVGSAVVQELIAAGHEVIGMARSEKGSDSLKALDIEVHHGSLQDLDSLKQGAEKADGVIHTAFIHDDFSNMAGAGAADKTAIEAFGDVLAGTNKPLVVTSGTAHLKSGELAIETAAPDSNSSAKHRIPSEEATLELASRGIRSMLIRLPPSVHGDGDYAFIPALIAIARAKAVSAYIGDGQNRWPAVHRLDAAHLFRLALEKGKAGKRYHAIGDGGIPILDIATVIGRRLNIPVVSKSKAEAAEHFGWLANFLAIDCPASSELTQEELGWRPNQPGLIADLEEGTYFKS